MYFQPFRHANGIRESFNDFVFPISAWLCFKNVILSGNDTLDTLLFLLRGTFHNAQCDFAKEMPKKT